MFENRPAMRVEILEKGHPAVKRTNLKVLFLAALVIFWMSGSPAGPGPGPAELKAAGLPAEGVIVYQFHRRFRCEACHTLEAAINESLRTYFPNELKEGRLVFMVVDLDAKGNGHYEKDYDFFYNTVIVVDRENGRETRYKNLEEVWSLVDKKEAAMEFIRSHVADYL